MGRIFQRKQFTDYLGENRAILDIYVSNYLDPSPTPSVTPTMTLTPSITPTISLTPSITPTNTVTPSTTCPTTTHYLKFVAVNPNPPTAELSIWSDSGLTIPANALCNYRVTGQVLSNLGNSETINQYIFQGNHSLLYNFNAWTFPGEYTVSTEIIGTSTTSGCTCPVILLTGSTITPTPTTTPTITPTSTITPTVTPTSTPPCYCEQNEVYVISGSISQWEYVNCNGVLTSGSPINAGNSVTVCACMGSVNIISASGTYGVNIGLECVTPTPTPTPTKTPTPTPTPSSFDTDYQNILNYGSSQGYVLPSAGQQIYQNQLVVDLKNSGIWTDLDILYIFATDGDENYAKLNWKNPGVYTIVENGSVNFTTNIGFKTNTTNVANFLDTQYSTQTNKTGYTLTDAARFTWDYDGTGTGVYDGALGGPRESFNGLNDSGQRIQQDANNLPSAFNNIGTGLKIIQRTSASNVNMYNNTSSPTSFTRNNSSLIAGNQVLFKRGDNNEPGSYRLSLYGLGASMTGKENDLLTSITNYMNSL